VTTLFPMLPPLGMPSFYSLPDLYLPPSAHNTFSPPLLLLNMCPQMFPPSLLYILFTSVYLPTPSLPLACLTRLLPFPALYLISF
jgi:hypothetical protein